MKAYEHFFFHYTSSDLLIVNTSEIDFVDHNEDLKELLRKVTEPMKGTQYFLPLRKPGSCKRIGRRATRDPFKVSSLSNAVPKVFTPRAGILTQYSRRNRLFDLNYRQMHPKM